MSHYHQHILFVNLLALINSSRITPTASEDDIKVALEGQNAALDFVTKPLIFMFSRV